MSATEDPWLALKPPASDAVTYLTFIEQNLTPEALPKLHNILQDQPLNQLIGWDLVHLLLPMLSQSEECLLDIARFGNPREVVLKVCESLRILELDGMGAHSDAEESMTGAEISTPANTKEGGIRSGEADEAELPLHVRQFKVILSMLSILHPRIKTKFPSRFLSTTLQAVLATYSRASAYHDEMTEDIIKIVKALTGMKRPVLPSRRSSSKLLLTGLAKSNPENEGIPDSTAAEDAEMTRRLFQSFLTHVLEDYMLSLQEIDGIPGLAWSVRLQEKSDPGHVVPFKKTITEKMADLESIQDRLSTVGSLIALTEDLNIDSQDLWKVALDTEPELKGDQDTEDEPPTQPSDIPFSKTGSLLLVTARRAAEIFYGHPSTTPASSIFPEHAVIVKNFLGTTSRTAMGLEPEVLVDAILFLGLAAIQENAIGEPKTDEEFTEYLQNISLLSANSASPLLRYQAHFLSTTVLRSHPYDLVRLTFIRDTLEHCPYENLKTSAVSWIKGETIEANLPDARPISESDSAPSIFATPIALLTLSPFLFPDFKQELSAPSLSDSYTHLQANLSFYLASLNFYYLLLKAQHLHAPLDIRGLTQQTEVGGNFLDPLKTAIARFKAGLTDGGELVDGDSTNALMELQILEDAVKRVEDGIKSLNAK